MLSDKVINLALDFHSDQNRSVLWGNSTHALRSSQVVMAFLWDTVNKFGNVSGTQIQRLATSLNRVLVSRDVIGAEKNVQREKKTPRQTKLPFQPLQGGTSTMEVATRLYTHFQADSFANHLLVPFA